MSPLMKWIMHVGTLIAMLVGAASLMAIVFYGGAWMGETTSTLKSIQASVTVARGDLDDGEERVDEIENRLIVNEGIDESQTQRISTLERFHYGSGG